MLKTDWSITSQYWDWTREDFLFTYDEEEKQNNEVNKNNASLILNPKFIPVSPIMIRWGYSYLEAILYWFIDFFLCYNEKFYCTNEQLWEMLWVSEKTISLAIKRLIDDWLIAVSYKIKSWGGKIRFLKNVNSDFTKMYSQTLQKGKGIYNKIIENKNNNISSSSVSNETSSEGNTINSNLLNSKEWLGVSDYTAQFDIFWKIYPHARKWKKQDAKKYFMQQDINLVMENVKLYKWKIELWIEDAKYVPACERWIRDFVPVNNVVKEQDLYKIVCKHMQMDGKKERYAELKNDFGTEKMDELVRKYNSNNKPTLYFK